MPRSGPRPTPFRRHGSSAVCANELSAGDCCTSSRLGASWPEAGVPPFTRPTSPHQRAVRLRAQRAAARLSRAILAGVALIAAQAAATSAGGRRRAGRGGMRRVRRIGPASQAERVQDAQRRRMGAPRRRLRASPQRATPARQLRRRSICGHGVSGHGSPGQPHGSTARRQLPRQERALAAASEQRALQPAGPHSCVARGACICQAPLNALLRTGSSTLAGQTTECRRQASGAPGAVRLGSGVDRARW
jgi:hypothetical protein